MLDYDGLLFDLDGTLWNSTLPVTRAWNKAAKKLGQAPITSEVVQSIMGLPHHECFERAFPKLSPADREALARVCTEMEMGLLAEHGAALYPGVRDGLITLAEHFPLYVVSNCETDYLEIFLNKSGIGKLFRDSECYGRTGKTKGENLKAVTERNKLKKPVYIGDTAGDQLAALSAGMDYYHVTYGFGDPGSDCLSFDSFPEVVRFLLK